MIFGGLAADYFYNEVRMNDSSLNSIDQIGEGDIKSGEFIES
jgi:hypothetical protein